MRGLGQVNRDLVQELARRGEPQKIATIDLDSTVIESWKKQSQPTYQGGRGYQPMLALWAEMNLVVADEFSGWQRPSAAAAADCGATCVSGPAPQRDGVLFSWRLGVS